MFDKSVDNSNTPSSCRDFADFDASNEYERMKADAVASPADAPAEKGAVYEEMAAHFLRAAVERNSVGDTPGTKMLLEGSYYPRGTSDNEGKRIDVDGVDDLLKLSAQNGGNLDYLAKMSKCSEDLKSRYSSNK